MIFSIHTSQNLIDNNSGIVHAITQWGQPGKNGIFHMKILVNLHIHQPIYFKSSSKPQLTGEKMEKNQSFRAQNHKIHVIFDNF